MSPSDVDLPNPPLQTPLFHAAQAPRYQRQEAIRSYEESTGRSLVVFRGIITKFFIPYFQDAITDVARGHPLDLMVTSPGGDPETALRMAKICRDGRHDFRVIIPETAASAATLLALAAEEIVMSSASALGPIDAQLSLPLRRDYVSAKVIIEIYEEITQLAQTGALSPDLLGALIADIDLVTIQNAKGAVKRTGELVPELIKLRQTPPCEDKIKQVCEKLQGPASHAAAIGHDQASELGLPITYVEPSSEVWDKLWRLHAQYVVLGPSPPRIPMVEGHRVSYEELPRRD